MWEVRREGWRKPAALKLLRADARQQEALAREVRAIAALDHAGVVRLLDFGTGEGEAWLVTELMAGGTLAPWRGRMSGRSLQRVIAQVLEALAHAHARGVVHRDIKPGNLLLARPDPLKARLAIVDFGVAHALGTEVATERRFGTPDYMAPEQIAGSARDHGPWTDLYSFGCTLYALITGAGPFGSSSEHALDGHLYRPPPELPASVPAWLADWVYCLMAKDPSKRFASAPAAAFALRGYAAGDRGLPAPPVPAVWQRQHRRRPPLTASLFGLRTLPIVGREHERELLWQAMRRAVDDGPELVYLVGGPGSGKSRLVSWVGQRAHELCGATTLRARYGPLAETAGGLRSAVLRELRCAGLSREGVTSRLQLRFPDDEVRRSLTELVAPSGGDRGERGAGQVLAVLRLLEELTEAGPVVLAVEDVQWGLEGLRLVSRLFASGRRLPVLIVVTAREQAMLRQAAEKAALRRLLEVAPATRIRLGPLEAEVLADLASAALPLSRAFARDLAKRANGSPDYVLRVLEDAVARERLRQTPGGLEGPVEELPVDLGAHWGASLGRQLRTWSPEEQHALEIAAALGTRVDRWEWVWACRAAGVPVPEALLQALVVLGWLATTAPEVGASFAFVRPGIRGALERRSRSAGRWRRWNAAVARMLSRASGVVASERLGRHLVAAGRPEEALKPLLEAARLRLQAREATHARLLLELREEAVEAAGLPADDPRVAAGWSPLASVGIALRDHALAERWSRRLVQHGEAHGALADEARGNRDLGRALYRLTGDPAEALPALRRAVQRATVAGDALLEGTCRRHLGWMYLRAGELPSAANHLERGRLLATAGGDGWTAQECAWGLAELARRRGRFGVARRLLEDAAAWFELQGAHVMAATMTSALGDVALGEGREDLAIDAYRAAHARLREVGSPALIGPELSLARLALLREAWDEATQRHGRLRRFAARPGHGWLLPHVAVGELVLDARERRWDRWDRAVQDLGDVVLDESARSLASWAVRLAEQAGEGERARALATR